MKPKPLPYRLLINALGSLGAYIPFEPSEPDCEFVIFSSSGSGGGYSPKGCGPRCGFITKQDDVLVPAKETEKLLNFLHFKPEIFWEAVNKLSPDPSIAVGQEAFDFTASASAAVILRKK